MPCSQLYFIFLRPSALLLLLLTVLPLHALDVTNDYHSLPDAVEFFVDENAELSLTDILSDQVQSQFQSSELSKPERLNQRAALWTKLTLDFNPTALDTPYVVTTMVNNYADIRIYRQQSDHSYSEYITGNNYPASQRELDSARYSFNISPTANQQTVYIRSIGSIDTFQLPWVLIKRELFDINSELFRAINLISMGVLFGILILCFGIGATLANKNYLAYSSFLLFGLLSLFNQDGLAFILFWPNNPEFNQRSVDIFNLGISITRLLTIMTFLELGKLSPRFYNFSMIWLGLLAIIFLLACAIGLKDISEYLGGITWLLSMLLGTGITLYAIIKKTPLAIPLFLILNLPIFGSLYQAAASTGLADISLFSLQAGKITFIIHAILFSICLAIEIQRKIDRRVVAQLDNLTGLPRIQLAKNSFKYAAAMADQYAWKLGVLFIDLDGFKAINDKYGHKAGDQVLVEVAARLKSCVRDVDTISRIGGDEFLLLQTEMKDKDTYTVVAENVCTALAKSFEIEGNRINLGASVGIAIYPDHGSELNTLMKAADQAMYGVKNTGKNHYAIASLAAQATP